jgi:hypothetical protein
MTTRYDILVGRPKQTEGTWWHKIGTAFEGKEGGMNCYLDSLPLPDKDGKVSFIIREAKAKDDAPPPRQQQRAAPAPSNGRAPINDDVPFDR